MDSIHGWEDEGERLGSKVAACMWIYTKGALTEAAYDVIMLCTNWVCAGIFNDHEWVSESTIAPHEEELMGMDLDYKPGIPCVVQWCMLWFSAPTRLNQTLGKDLRIIKYHEAVDMAIAEAISKPFGDIHSPRTCMLPSVATVLHETHRKWKVTEEMEGWEMGGKNELLPCVGDGVHENSDE